MGLEDQYQKDNDERYLRVFTLVKAEAVARGYKIVDSDGWRAKHAVVVDDVLHIDLHRDYGSGWSAYRHLQRVDLLPNIQVSLGYGPEAGAFRKRAARINFTTNYKPTPTEKIIAQIKRFFDKVPAIVADVKKAKEAYDQKNARYKTDQELREQAYVELQRFQQENHCTNWYSVGLHGVRVQDGGKIHVDLDDMTLDEFKRFHKAWLEFRAKENEVHV